MLRKKQSRIAPSAPGLGLHINQICVAGAKIMLRKKQSRIAPSAPGLTNVISESDFFHLQFSAKCFIII